MNRELHKTFNKLWLVKINLIVNDQIRRYKDRGTRGPPVLMFQYLIEKTC
jgi:hypothetical protein